MYSPYEYTDFSLYTHELAGNATRTLFYIGPPLGDDPLAAITQRDEERVWCNVTLTTDLHYGLENAERGDKIYAFEVNLLHCLPLEHTPISGENLLEYISNNELEVDLETMSHYAHIFNEPFRSGSSISGNSVCQPYSNEGGDVAARFLASQGVGYIKHNKGIAPKGNLYDLSVTLLDPRAINSITPRSFASLRAEDYEVQDVNVPYIPTRESATLHYQKHLTERNRKSIFDFEENVILIGSYALARLDDKGVIYFASTEKPSTPIQSKPLWNKDIANWYSEGERPEMFLPSNVFDFADHAIRFVPAFMLEV